MVEGAFDNFFGDCQPDFGVFRDAGFVVGDADHSGAILFDQRQHGFQPFFFAGHRVDQRLALVDGEPALQCGDDRGVDREGGVGDRLHDLDGCGQDGGFVGQRDAGVDVQHMGAGRQLGVGILDHAREVAGGHFCRQFFASGRVDAFADDDKRAVGADADLFGVGTDSCFHLRALLCSVGQLQRAALAGR